MHGVVATAFLSQLSLRRLVLPAGREPVSLSACRQASFLRPFSMLCSGALPSEVPLLGLARIYRTLCQLPLTGTSARESAPSLLKRRTMRWMNYGKAR